MNDEPTNQTADFSIFPSVGFAEWLESTGGSLIFSSYQSGKILTVGRNPDGALRANERTFKRCMGIAVSRDQQRLYLATQHEIFRLDNLVGAGETWEDGSDALFVPRRTWITGALDAHDIGLDEKENPTFINTRFNCLANTADGYSFNFLWRPKFISALVPEDRCHLNGLAMVEGEPRFATAVSTTDHIDGWRDNRSDGGVVIDLLSGDIVCSGLSMPHSPRMHDGRLWILNSGRGELGWVDTKNGVFNPVAFCDGYARGLTFFGHFAIVGLSLPRHENSFQGLPLEEVLANREMEPRCGISVIDLNTGRAVGGLKIDGSVREIYDLHFLSGVVRPSIIGFRSNELQNLISVAPSSDPRAKISQRTERPKIEGRTTD